MTAATLARRSIKLAALPFGIAAKTRPGDLVILGYHRVGVGDREIDLDAGAFDQHLGYLSAAAPVRSLDAAISAGVGGVVVTLDDGYGDFHEFALPILVRHQVPAVLYLATGLADESGSDRARLSWSQIREAHATGLVTVGSHTHGHVDLSRASTSEAEREMRRSKELIEDQLGVECRHFAYPWSVASPAAEAQARQLFSTAALLWGTNRRGRIDRNRLARTPVLRSDGQAFFRTKVHGMLDEEAVAYRVLRRGPWRRL